MDVSNPDKVMFPERGLTKSDLVGHYEQVAERMLPWISGRPLTLERYPNGVAEKGFMQKNASSHFSDHIGRVEVPKSDGTTTHPLVSDAEGLMELANQGTIAFHVWTARTPDLDRPTHLVLDLDPEPDGAGGAREVARAARDVLDRHGIGAGLAVSGKKGFHLWCPVAGLTDDEAALAARALAGIVAIERPDTATTEFLKKDREGRVFVDWLRNGRAQTIVCPWSLRVTPSANVAVPITWDELDTTDPDRWHLGELDGRENAPMPDPTEPDVGAITDAARDVGVDLDTDIDRFGRRR